MDSITPTFAQVQTNAPLHFNKPFVLVTRMGENDTNNAYHNPRQHYYEFDNMKMVFHYAKTCMKHGEVPVSALRIIISRQPAMSEDGVVYHTSPHSEYFHNFTAALDEYKRGIRVEM